MGFTIALLEIAVFRFPDLDLTPFPAPTVLQRVCGAILFIVTLPLPILGFICNKLDIQLPESLLYALLITPGLFWATVINLLSRARRRRAA